MPHHSPPHKHTCAHLCIACCTLFCLPAHFVSRQHTNCASTHTLLHCTNSPAPHTADCSAQLSSTSASNMEYTAVQVNAFDAAAPTGSSTLVQRTLSDPGATEVQVKLLYAGVNPSGTQYSTGARSVLRGGGSLNVRSCAQSPRHPSKKTNTLNCCSQRHNQMCSASWVSTLASPPSCQAPLDSMVSLATLGSQHIAQQLWWCVQVETQAVCRSEAQLLAVHSVCTLLLAVSMDFHVLCHHSTSLPVPPSLPPSFPLSSLCAQSPPPSY